ncbi:MAG: tetratricopeptide repeat protein [Bacteroidia bacterium]|nr:tetratricopeptide repeat protein [Bacteroidia bacterium]
MALANFFQKTGIKTWLAIGLFLATLILYANTFSHDFAWDDAIVITENPRVQEGISGISAHFFKYKSEQLADQYGYRPIVLSSFSIEYELFGLKATGYHVMNVIFYGLTCVFLFLALTRVFPRYSPWLPFLVAALYLVHPLHVEAVANIKSRDEIFAMMFSLLSLYYFMGYAKEKSWLKFALSLFFLTLGVLSKENAATFLAILPLAVLIQEEGTWKEKLKTLLPLPALLVIALVVLVVIPQADSLDATAYKETQDTGIFHEDKSLGNVIVAADGLNERLGTALYTLLLYLGKFLFPHPLTYYSGANQIPLVGMGNPLSLLALLIHLGAAVFSLVFFKKHKVFAFGILYYLATISVFSNIPVVLNDTMADRFQFMPSLGLCLVLVWGLGLIFKVDFSSFSWGKRDSKIPAKKPNPVFLFLLGALMLGFGLKTFSRNQAWKDNATLFETDMPNLENCARAHYHYAGILAAKLNLNPQNKALGDKVIHHFKRAAEISEHAYYARMKLGQVYMFLGRGGEAISTLQELVRTFPEQGRPKFHLGYAYFQMGKFQEAIDAFKASKAQAENRADLYFYMAQAYKNLNQPDEAILVADEGAARFPEEVNFYDLLSDLYFQKENSKEAILQIQRVFEYQPLSSDAWIKLVLLYQNFGMPQEAQNTYNEALAKGVDMSRLTPK